MNGINGTVIAGAGKRNDRVARKATNAMVQGTAAFGLQLEEAQAQLREEKIVVCGSYLMGAKQTSEQFLKHINNRPRRCKRR